MKPRLESIAAPAKLPKTRKKARSIGAPSIDEFQAAIARHCAAKQEKPRLEEEPPASTPETEPKR